MGYNVWDTEVESRHRGGVAVVWIVATGWQVENTARFVPNVVNFLLTLGARRWYVMRAYVLPNNGPSVNHVDQALQAAPKGLEIILMGDLNAQMENPRDKCEEDLATALADRGLVNMIDNFLPRRRYR